MIGAYILKGHEPVPEPNPIKWAVWFEKSDRKVKETIISLPLWKIALGTLFNICKWKQKSSVISTVFLGLDHNFSGTGSPILFETMVFGQKFDGEMARYSTWEEAKKGHDEMVKIVRKGY